MSQLDVGNLRGHLEQNLYAHLRELPDGTIIGVRAQLFTTGLFVGLDFETYAFRYCYEHTHDAVAAAQTWDGKGDPPGPWIKLKGAHVSEERLGPGAVDTRY